MLNKNKVLAVNFLPDQTQVVYGKIKKNQLYLLECAKLPSVFDDINNFRQDSVYDFLANLSEKFKCDAFYIGLSSELIKSIVFKDREHVTKDDWDAVIPNWMAKEMGIDSKDFVINTPLICNKEYRMIISGVAIRKTYIDLLYNASIKANLPLRSIEPACFALLRYINNWNSESFILEVTDKGTHCISFSPIRGLFKSLYSAGWEDYLSERGGMAELEQCISTFDYAAFNTYERANNNIPIYVISSKSDQIYALARASNLGERFQICSDSVFVKNDNMREMRQHTSAIGLALTSMHERMINICK
jgi:hypothetical protein